MTRVLRAVAAGVAVLICVLLIAPPSSAPPASVPPAAQSAVVDLRPALPPDPAWGMPSAPPIACIGDGQDGSRVQVLYAAVEGHPDRFAEVVGDIGVHVGWTNRVFQQSAAIGGGDRQVRFVHDADCEVHVERVVVGPEAMQFNRNGQPRIYGMVRAAGHNRTDRLYLVFLDHVVGGPNYCGAASRYHDDQPGTLNKNNTGDRVAVIDTRCWEAAVTYTPAHELAHAFGAVQASAPNQRDGHCTDGPDVLCRAETSEGLAAGCTPRVLDCGGDDYFNPSPDPGSYLDTHWNIADSVFLEDQAPDEAQLSPDPDAAEA